MNDRLIRDNPVSDEQIQAWADEAERGYDLTKLPSPLPGRPLVGNGPGAGTGAWSGRSHAQPHQPTPESAHR